MKFLPNYLNPCKEETVGKKWADPIYAGYIRLNKGAEQCACCSFWRGAIVFGVIGFFIGIIF